MGRVVLRTFQRSGHLITLCTELKPYLASQSQISMQLWQGKPQYVGSFYAHPKGFPTDYQK